MEVKKLTAEQLGDLEAQGRVNLGAHACGRAYAQLGAYNYGIPDGEIDYRVACFGCHIQTFAGQTPQEAYAMWQEHLMLTNTDSPLGGRHGE